MSAGSTFGHLFRVTTAGESHGPANVVIVDGVPAGLALSVDDLLPDLARRRPGQSAIVTQRKEDDTPEILSGVFEGYTTGTSIAVVVRNKDQRGRDYANLAETYRPGHADYTFDAKFGRRDYRGGGRSSARETVSRVIAGAIAKRMLAEHGIVVLGFVSQVGDIVADVQGELTLERIEMLPDGSPNIVRCPDPIAAAKMVDTIKAVRKEQDSIGGIAEIRALGVPPGLGEPVFDKLRADVGKAILSLPAVLGVEFGTGFSAAHMRGSEHNDHFHMEGGRVATTSNRHGGMLGGISTGMPIVLRAVVKPTSSLPREQPTVTSRGEETTVATRGRHDPCLLPRFVPMAEAMVAITLADHWLRHRASRM